MSIYLTFFDNKENTVPFSSSAGRLQEFIAAAKSTCLPYTNVKKVLKVKERAGSGGYGVVYEGFYNKQHIAIKKMPNLSHGEKKINLREIAFLHHLKHPNVVRYLGGIFPEEECWILMEWMDGGTLHEAVVSHHNFMESHIAFVGREILEGLAYLHSLGIIHRDLKSKNIMMSVEGHVRLIDFGLCVHAENSGNKIKGSPFWISPEMIQGNTLSYKADIYAFGVVLLEMLKKNHPHSKSRVKAMYKAATQEYNLGKLKCSEKCKSFLARCLRLKPEDRATASELLKDPFLELADSQAAMKRTLASIFLANRLFSFNIV